MGYFLKLHKSNYSVIRKLAVTEQFRRICLSSSSSSSFAKWTLVSQVDLGAFCMSWVPRIIIQVKYSRRQSLTSSGFIVSFSISKQVTIVSLLTHEHMGSLDVFWKWRCKAQSFKGLCKNYSGITTIFFHSILLVLEKTQVSYRLNWDLDEVVAISCLAATGDIANAPAWPQGFSPCDITRCGKVIYGGLLLPCVLKFTMYGLHGSIETLSGSVIPHVIVHIWLSLQLCWEQSPWLSCELGWLVAPHQIVHIFSNWYITLVTWNQG